jgi:hypothetical protein
MCANTKSRRVDNLEENLKVDEDVTKMYLKQDMTLWTGFIGPQYRQVRGCRQHGDEPSGVTRGGTP